jgi:hypothetical protein
MPRNGPVWVGTCLPGARKEIEADLIDGSAFTNTIISLARVSIKWRGIFPKEFA